MAFDFWLLDINSGGFDDKHAIFLWGIDSNGKRILVVDRIFKPSFYISLSRRQEMNRKIKEIENALTERDLSVALSKVTREISGRTSELIKVEYENPDQLGKIISRIRKISGIQTTYDSDIRPSASYLLQKDAVCSNWIRVEASMLPRIRSFMVDSVFELVSPVQSIRNHRLPSLKVMAFDILYLSETGSPDPKTEPIRAISINIDGRVVTLEARGEDDSPVIRGFTRTIEEKDPDILVSFGSNRRDWPYLLARARIHEISLKVSRMGTEPHQSAFGHFSITGRANIDLEDLVADIPGLQLGTLGALADNMEIRPPAGFEDLEPYEVKDLWTTRQGKTKALWLSSARASLVSDLFEDTIEFVTQLSKLTRLPLDQVLAAAMGFRVDSYLMSKAREFDEAIPERQERPYFPYAGGMVLEPKTGLHEKVDVIDFRSMYPNIIVSFNLSPETLMPKSDASLASGLNIVPELGYRFAKEPQGFFPRSLQALLEERKEIKRQLKDAKDAKLRILTARESVTKTIANAMYGYSGWLGSRWYCREVAESTTSYGRNLMSKAIRMAEDEDLRIIYGDTDSIFVSHDDNRLKHLLERIQTELGFEVRLDKMYERVLFTEAKKRYAGKTTAQKLEIVGLEAVRSDWSEIARKTQRQIISLILDGEAESSVRGRLDQITNQIRAGECAIKDFIIWKTMSRPVEEYKVRAPHVEAARSLLSRGWTIKAGDRVGYIVTRAYGEERRKVKPYPYVSRDEIDVEYYVQDQIVPPSLRVIESAFVQKQAKLKSKVYPAKASSEISRKDSERMKEAAKEFAASIRNLSPSTSIIVHHGDADGLCGAAILSKTLEKIRCKARLVCLEKLFPEVLRQIHSGEYDLVAYVDLGSPHVNRISAANLTRKPVLVIDHHDFEETEDITIMNFNPELYGVSGESEASSSIMAYVISREIEASAEQLSPIALIGSAELPGSPIGINLEVLGEAIQQGLAKVSKSGKGKSINIRLGQSWINRQKASAILTALGSVGYYRDGPLIATSSVLTGLSEDTVDLAQRMEIERKAAFDGLLDSIRKKGLKRSENMQWVEVGSSFKGMGSKVIGTFLSILRYSRIVNPSKYLLGFMELEPTIPGLGVLKGGWSKVSGRIPPRMESSIRSGERRAISDIMMTAAEQVGGFADGHAYAASGVVPRGSEERFIGILDASVSK